VLKWSSTPGFVGKELLGPALARAVKFDYFRREQLYYTPEEKGYRERARPQLCERAYRHIPGGRLKAEA
jgi:hypothetical protein